MFATFEELAKLSWSIEFRMKMKCVCGLHKWGRKRQIEREIEKLAEGLHIITKNAASANDMKHRSQSIPNCMGYELNDFYIV